MSVEAGSSRELASLRIAAVGSLRTTGDAWEPFQLVDAAGEVIVAVGDYLKDLQAAGRRPATQRSYAMDLLRWWRFLWAIKVPWDEATRSEARDFARWLQIADKPVRPHRRQDDGTAAVVGTGTPAGGRRYAAATGRHSESVLRRFYDFHLEAGTGPMVNPFPLARGRHGERAGAHRNPMDPPDRQRSGLFRPRGAQSIPRSIPDDDFNELFAQLSCHRDRALVAFWISTGARASELLGAMRGDADPGQQLITVVRKGTRALQPLPASADAFVWLRLYQAEIDGVVPAGGAQPLWWTRRRPFRTLSYHAARAMFGRAAASLGADWTLHDLRHSAAYRMARDPHMPLADVQWVLGHARLSTTQLYVTAPDEDVIASVLAHHRRQAEAPAAPPPEPGVSYRPETLAVLFGGEAGS